MAAGEERGAGGRGGLKEREGATRRGTGEAEGERKENDDVGVTK